MPGCVDAVCGHCLLLCTHRLLGIVLSDVSLHHVWHTDNNLLGVERENIHLIFNPYGMEWNVFALDALRWIWQKMSWIRLSDKCPFDLVDTV